MTHDFLGLLFRLNRENVEFVIIGGFAGVIYGCTLVTQDVDICCEFSPENLMHLQDALAGIHPVHRMTTKRIELSLTRENCGDYKNLYLDTDIGQLDCVSHVKGVGGYDQASKVSQIVEVENTKFKVLNLDALIEAKKAMNRPHDREAVIQLQAIKQLKE